MYHLAKMYVENVEDVALVHGQEIEPFLKELLIIQDGYS